MTVSLTSAALVSEYIVSGVWPESSVLILVVDIVEVSYESDEKPDLIYVGLLESYWSISIMIF